MASNETVAVVQVSNDATFSDAVEIAERLAEPDDAGNQPFETVEKPTQGHVRVVRSSTDENDEDGDEDLGDLFG